jgi:hypothetical protein
LLTSGAERRRLGATIGVPRGTGAGMRGVQEGPGSETLRCRIRQQLCEMEVIWATDVSMLCRAMHPVDSSAAADSPSPPGQSSVHNFWVQQVQQAGCPPLGLLST